MTIFTIQKQLQSVGMNKMVKDKKIDNLNEFMELIATETLKIEGVSSMGSNFTDPIPKFGTTVKGVRASEGKEGIYIELYVKVKYRMKIPQLAWDIQNRIKEIISKKYQIAVKEINIHVQGVEMTEDK